MTTDTISRHKIGGFEDRFRVTRTDGKLISPYTRYVVLNYGRDEDGNPLDPNALSALLHYADCVQAENPQLADDFRDAVENPKSHPHQHDYPIA